MSSQNWTAMNRQQDHVPEAPYPPMVGSSIIKPSSTSFGFRKNKLDSSVDQTSLKSDSNGSGKSGDVEKLKSNSRPLQINSASVIPPSRPVHQQVPKRQVPCSRIEFYNTQLYGAINCLDHVYAQERKEDHDEEQLYNSNRDVTESYQDIATKTHLSNQSSATMTSTVTSSQSLFPVKKMGPVLLELRYLHPVVSSQNHRHLQSQTIALSRGISSLGTNVSSTCLSFRSFSTSKQHHHNPHQQLQQQQQQQQQQQNPQLVSKDPLHMDTVQVATGLTTGALCIHTLRNLYNYIPSFETNDAKASTWEMLDSNKSDDASISYFSHYQPRQHRHASAVAWRSGGANSNFVAIGLVGSGSGGVDRVGGGASSGAGVAGSVGAVAGMSGSASGVESYRSVGRAGLGSSGMATMGSDYHSAGYASSKDRDYCALIWDVEASSKGVKQTPVVRLAHNSGVASLAWMSNGDLLAVGCMQRSIQIYDLRIQGTSAPPISTNAHDNAVHGIKVDHHSEGSFMFATFSKGLAEPVKLWDMRRMDSCVSEIKLNPTKSSRTSAQTSNLVSVSDIEWDTSSSGILSVVCNDIIRYYDTRINPSRPTLSRMTHSHATIQSVAFLPRPAECQRMIAIDVDGYVRDLPLHQVAPLEISNRDGRVSCSTEGTVWAGSATEGPSAMERLSHDLFEDISATMMRRARCLHFARYSTDATSNLKMIHSELESIHKQVNTSEYLNLEPVISSREQLWRLWSWIERVEQLCARMESDAVIDERRLPARGLHDAGILKLLKLDVPGSDEISTFETTISSSVFNRDIFDSPMRRAVLTACGWVGVFGIQDAITNIEAQGYFERSAILSVWNSNVGEAVDALQRGAERIRSEAKVTSSKDMRYAETLELVAMCIAGYTGSSDPKSKAAAVWKRACESLLKRSDLNVNNTVHFKSRGAYLRAICTFLLSASNGGDLRDTLDNELLSLSDRCAFACIFLPRNNLKTFLESKVEDCIKCGNLEGILITGIDQLGFSLLQSYVDRFSDVQTAALVSSRVVLPSHMSKERMIASEWLETYREMLNKWQMWQSRALFDVGRVELLRKLRHQAEEVMQNNTSMATVRTLRRTNVYSQSRRPQLGGSKQQTDSESSPQAFPPQIQARCNYCNTSLSLSKLIRRQDGIANNWLSRQNPVLSCCPNSQCRKPLPRCAICLLPLGCLNPYLELRKHGLQSMDDLSELSNLPFAEWFTWCMRCKHGGHTHHMVGWFSNHSTCPVSNCNCQCQFDGIQKLKRVGLAHESDDVSSSK